MKEFRTPQSPLESCSLFGRNVISLRLFIPADPAAVAGDLSYLADVALDFHPFVQTPLDFSTFRPALMLAPNRHPPHHIVTYNIALSHQRSSVRRRF